MSTKIAIELNSLTKTYRLYNHPLERLKESLHPFRRKYHHTFTALKDISFLVPQGQVLGIIGKNGSGKSTLLKMISGILSPTSGSVKVNGKVAALLELGAGFNPELTGLANIYLNGALMGFSRQKMNERVGDILEFADIGEFIHQPVKLYSSGMFVRLAFAVAINVDPDILIVDEALSVGDLRFQQKCIRKIQDFFKAGKTVLFVGHDMNMINTFCSHCVWIDSGVLREYGLAQDVTKNFTSFMAYGETSQSHLSEDTHQSAEWLELSNFDSFGDRTAVIKSLRMFKNDAAALGSFLGGEKIELEFKLRVQSLVQKPIIGFNVKDRLGRNVFGGNSFVYNVHIEKIELGEHTFRISFQLPFLTNGDYLLSLALADGDLQNHVQKHWVHDCFKFVISNPELRYQNDDGLVMENNLFFEKVKNN